MKGLTKTEDAAACILRVAAALLENGGGRPRKPPLKDRPRATTRAGVAVSYVNWQADRFSLTGAVDRAAYALRAVYSKGCIDRGKALAKEAIVGLEGCGFTRDYVNGEFDYLDTHTHDDREVFRILRRASITLTRRSQ